MEGGYQQNVSCYPNSKIRVTKRLIATTWTIQTKLSETGK